MEVRTERFVLAGYSEATGDGEASVARFDRRDRVVRAMKGLGAMWGLAVVTAFIPVAHLLLVPGFGLAGIGVFAVRLRRREVVRAISGRCPHCGTDQRFEAGGAWTLPRELGCGHCNRTLSARAPAGATRVDP